MDKYKANRSRILRLYTIFALCFVATLWLLSRPSKTPSLSSSRSVPISKSGSGISVDPHLQKEDLSLVLSSTESETPSIRVTVTNYHYSTAVSLLAWSSPFDPSAVATGIFNVTDRATGRESPYAGLKISRLLAPKAEDFIKLLPRHAVTKDVPLDAPDILLQPGRSYDVQIKSSWKGVWHASSQDIGELRLRRMGGPTGLVNWEFESNKLQVNVPFKEHS